jgi:pyruvate ferredoxin oxidoreductase delta subunit
VNVTAGLRPGGLVLVNADAVPDALAGGSFSVATVAATELAHRHLGTAHTSTAMLGFLARATGWIERTAVAEATAGRLRGASGDANMRVALEAFDSATGLELPATWDEQAAPDERPAPLDAALSVGLSAAPGSSALRPTGGWRTEVPRFLAERCTGCDLCAVFCPEGIVFRVDKRRYEFDPAFCKGCGICAAECPTDDIVMEEVVR